MGKYIHRVQYYETDKMGITHHSNYIRWMEEARVDFLAKIGYPYNKLEEIGVISPVIGVECNYINPSTFNDDVEIEVAVEEYKGVRLVISYIMTNIKTNEKILEGKTRHCFVNSEGKPIILKKNYSDLDKVLRDYIVKEDKNGYI